MILRKSKIIALMVSFTVFLAACLPAAAATINLTYWYDGESIYIGHWTTSPTLYTENMDSNNSSFYFATALASAKSQWSTALNLGIASTMVQSYSDIKFYGGTLDNLADVGLYLDPNIDDPTTSEVLGKTRIMRESDDTDVYYWGSQQKYGRILLEVKSGLLSMGLTSSECKKTATHEMGHALGYTGHDTVSATAVMRQGRSSSYTLTSRDKLHLQQVY